MCHKGFPRKMSRSHRANTRRICRARGDVLDPNLPIDPYLRPHSVESVACWGGAVVHTVTIFPRFHRPSRCARGGGTLSENRPSPHPKHVQTAPSREMANADSMGAFRLSLACVLPFPPFVISRSAVRIHAPAFLVYPWKFRGVAWCDSAPSSPQPAFATLPLASAVSSEPSTAAFFPSASPLP